MLIRTGLLAPSGEPTLLQVAPRGLDEPEVRARLRREQALAAALADVPHVIQPLALEETPDALILSYRDPGTYPWTSLPRPMGRELGRFLHLAVAATEAVAALHARRYMHLGLCPEALRLATDAGAQRVYLLGLGDASRLRTEVADAQSAVARPERLPYLAPEQTGRMNRAVDRRADLYALGVLLFEVLTGQRPFQADDALGWVHAHLARRPLHPERALPGVPEAISAVLLKLLSKDAEERYRSAAGLLADWRLLLERWETDAQLDEVPLGRADVDDLVRVPERLYGRQAELRTLEETFARAAAGATAALWVKGEPGIGKSRLIGELVRPVTSRGGLFASGKADQLRRNLPFDAPVQAVRGLLSQVLAWPEGRLNDLRTATEEALGANAAVLTEVLPELAVLLPGRPPAPVLGGQEAELRFRLTFQKLVPVLATAEHPLVLFLDDLQWADAASLALLEGLLGTEGAHLCLLGSWRDGEVDARHPLTELLGRLEAAGRGAPTLALGPLPADGLRNLVFDALGGTLTAPEPEEVTALAGLIAEKTGANPFFAGRLLQSLAEDAHIAFDHARRRFTVDRAAIARAGLSDNVAVHVGRDLARLPESAREVLQCGAALGARFEVGIAAQVLGLSPEAIDDALFQASELGIVRRVASGTFEFVHDHLQRVSYNELPAERRGALHRAIARTLLGESPPEALGEAIFTVAHHYAQAAAHLQDAAERDRAAQVLLAAGRRAQASGAPEGAVQFLRQGIAVLGETPFAAAPDLGAELHLGLAEAERANRNAEEALRLCDVVEAHSGRAWDRVRVAELRVYLLNNLLRMVESGNQALAVAASLGHPVKPALSMEDVIACLGRVEAARAGRDPAELSQLPELTDPEAAAVVRILAAALPTLAMGNPPLHVPAMTEVLVISLTQGLTPDSAFAVAHWQIIMAATGQYAYAYALGRQIQVIRDRFPDRPTIAGLVEFPVFGQHFVEPFRHCARDLHWGARRSLELGNPTGYGYCANQVLQFELAAGEPIPLLEQTYRKVRAGITEHQQFLALTAVEIWGQLIASLQGQHAGDPSRLDGPRLKFDEAMAELRRISVATSVLYGATAAMWLATIFGRPDRVLDIAREYGADLSAPVNLAAIGQPLSLWFRLLARLDTGEGLEDPAAFPAELARLRAVAEPGADNHRHRVLLVEAELAARAGNLVEAGTKLEAAFAHAKAQRLLHDAALIAERASRIAATIGGVLARAWQREAVEQYAAWGATEKVRELRVRWPDAVPAAEAVVASGGSRTLDLDAVLKASETITGEMDLERLLTRIMRLVCTAGGAERGALLLERDDALRVEAVASGEQVEVLQGVPAAEHPEICPEIAQYVARTMETLILADAGADPRFAACAYVRDRRPRSVLCAPLVHQGKRTGVLYLENNLASGAFTSDRIEVLRLLAFQAATSIENALLYAEARTQAEEMRAKNEALSAVDRLKDELLARTSHELRTPLHGIIGLAQTINETAELDGASRRSLDMIVSSGRRLANLINDILDFQTLKRREINLALGAVPLRDAVDSVLDLVRPLVAGRPVALVNAVADPDLVVYADPDRLAQVLLNLVGNAVKFTEAGEVAVDALVTPELITIRVRDTGIGISPEAQARIFEGFEQGDAGIARRFGGAGLGLSVARQLVELHGGTIGVESTPGKGSTFFFTLHPVRSESLRISRAQETVRDRVTRPLSTSQPTEIVPTSQEGRGRRVLVVDDEPVNLQVVMNQLARAGYEVTTALNGPDALRMLADGLAVDAVLLDVMMPRMDGYEVCTRLRQGRPAHELPVIMLTAKNQVTDLIQGLESGANDYVTKPFTGKELLARLRTHMHLSHVNQAIGQFVPYPFLSILGRESIVDVRLGDSVGRDMTVLFANMRAFTRLSEQMSPEESFRFINDYLGLMEPAVVRHGGFVDKYIGDAVMALFDGPPDNAVRAGLDMNRALADFNQRRAASGREPVRIGVGVNTGRLVLGTVGSERRMDTTVISEAVNIASRLETLTRRYDTQLLVTGQTQALLVEPGAWASRLLDQVMLPGRSEVIPVHEIYAADPDNVRAAKDATRPTFEQAVRAFHARAIPEAERLFNLCQALNPADTVVRQYLDRCRKIQMQFSGLAWGADA